VVALAVLVETVRLAALLVLLLRVVVAAVVVHTLTEQFCPAALVVGVVAVP
jgi:hypothetical protein